MDQLLTLPERIRSTTMGRRTFTKIAGTAMAALFLPSTPSGPLVLPDDSPVDAPKKLWVLDRMMIVPSAALRPDSTQLIWDTRWDRYELVGNVMLPHPQARLKPKALARMVESGEMSYKQAARITYLEMTGRNNITDPPATARQLSI